MRAGDAAIEVGARRRRVSLALATFPFVACVAMSFAFAYDAPYWDEWAFAVPIAHAFNGTLAPADFIVRINEHVCVVLSLIVIPLARVTHWDLRWEIGVILAFFAGTFLLLFRALVVVERESGRRGSWWVAPIAACAVFSLSQYAVWNWGLLICLATGIFFSVAAIHVLGCGPLSNSRLIIAEIFGWLATYSIGGGLGVWPAGVVAILLRARQDSSRIRKPLLWWIGVGTSAVAVYILLAGDAAHGALAQRTIHPMAIVVYMLAFMGGPLAVNNGAAAVALGVVFLCVTGAWAAHALRKKNSVAPFVLGLVTAVLTVGALTALKHSNEGTINAISSRFLPWGTLAWCGLAIAVYSEFPVLREATLRVRVAVAVATIAVLMSSAFGAYKADEHHDAFLLGRMALIEEPESEDMKYLHPDPESVKPLRKLLIQERLTVFRHIAKVAADLERNK